MCLFWEQLNASKDFALYEKQNWENIRDEFPDWKDFQDPDLLRKFKELTFLGAAALPEDKLEEVCSNVAHRENGTIDQSISLVIS